MLFDVETQKSSDFAERIFKFAHGARLLSTFEERLLLCDSLAKEMLRPKSVLRKSLPADGLAFLATFLGKAHLTAQMSLEIGDLNKLDKFVKISERQSLRLVSRGVVGHWVAGNVPLLAVYSWALSALVGNRNVVRLSSRQADVISPLLAFLAEQGGVGEEMAKATFVTRFDRGDATSHAEMSRQCDVRIAWGGREAIESIKASPSSWDCDDIVFGPRASMAYFDSDLITEVFAQRIATDIAAFDQLACSSPQVLYLRKGDKFDAAVNHIKQALENASQRFARHKLDYGETTRIELDRARAILRGASVLRDDQNNWTIVVSSSPEDDYDCSNLFIQIVPVESYHDVLPLIPRNVQTVVTLLDALEFEAFTNDASQLGVCRFPIPGTGNNFENPWDGMGLVSRLTRSVTRTTR
jgi:hypothetical protein